MTIQQLLMYIAIGISAGLLSGFFGVGGGLIIVPALVFIAGFSQFTATGTSLAVLLPPIGIIAALEYYRRGHVNFKAALIIAVCLMLASWFSARMTRKIDELYIRLGFGMVLTIIGIIFIITALRKFKP